MSVLTRMYRGETHFDFVGTAKKALLVSAGLIVLSLLLLLVRPLNLSIDFTGGVSIQVLFSEDQDIALIRSELSDLNDLAVSAVTVQGEAPNRRFIVNTSITAGTDAEQYWAALWPTS